MADYRSKELLEQLEIAIEMGDQDLIDQLRGDLYREYGLYNEGGEAVVKSTDDSFSAALKNAMSGKPISTALFMDMGFDRLFDIIQTIPMMKKGGIASIDELTKPVGMLKDKRK
jgi:hypothetical protein|tara:strand:+ start:1005 stop:1346 length:342 start_codon:yes stop_codon:yes gene_type:complete